jgi:hypothetical protein
MLFVTDPFPLSPIHRFIARLGPLVPILGDV